MIFQPPSPLISSQIRNTADVFRPEVSPKNFRLAIQKAVRNRGIKKIFSFLCHSLKDCFSDYGKTS